MSVYKRGAQWWYDFTIKGRRYRKPLPTARTKKKAEELEDKARVSVYDGTYEQPKAATLGQFIDEVFWPWALANYRTPEKSYASHKKVVRAFFAATPIKDISPLLIEKFKRERLNAPAREGKARKPATVNRDLQLLSRILTMARVNGLIRENPSNHVKLLRADNQRSRYLSDEEESRLLDYLSSRPKLRRVVEFALNTGMRRGEIVSLAWQDVDRSRGIIHVRKTKTGKDRSMPLNAAAARIIAEMETITGNQESVFDIAAAAISDGFHTAVEKLKISDLRFHDLRHTFATRLGDAGEDPFTIAELTGHSDLKMVKRYTHALERNKRRAVESLCHKSVTSMQEKREKAG